VGELCRYLLAQPPSPKDTEHSLRIIYGVGLRPQIWNEFVQRFKIPRVAECYGSTEGNVGFLNIDGKPGAIGFTSVFVEYIKQQYLIKVDMQSNEPIRDKNGFCVLCKTNEPGELIGKITTSKFNSFDGYLQKDATKKKHLPDAFSKGDLYFRTGDILMKDEEGYVFFVDRTGDTFRWYSLEVIFRQNTRS
jgi:acyl-CoA synthetase (AMP-forming)/AMP-acid ligase II